MSRDDELEQALEQAADVLRRAQKVCVLTGAGVSAESGVPTFRASDGLWEGHHIEDVASPDGFERDPRLVWSFYNARRANVKTVQPNPGHHALVKLENRFGNRFALVTQNVDGLHRVAGTKNLLDSTAACTGPAAPAVASSPTAGWSRCRSCRTAGAGRCSARTSCGSTRPCRKTSGPPPHTPPATAT